MPPKAKPNLPTAKKQPENKPNTGKARSTKKESEPGEGTASAPKQDSTAAPRRSARNAGKVSSSEQAKDDTSAKTGEKRVRSKADNDKQSKAQPAKDKDDDEEPKAKKPKTETKDGKKIIGSKHDKAAPPAQQGSNTRLPRKGQTAHWKAMPGWVDGKVVEILTASKSVDGKQVKASKDEPRIVLKSNAKSGKICVHKPDNVYFD